MGVMPFVPRVPCVCLQALAAALLHDFDSVLGIEVSNARAWDAVGTPGKRRCGSGCSHFCCY